MPGLVFGVFLGTIFIWTMAANPGTVKKQMVICYKFNENIDKIAIDAHMADFTDLKRNNAEIVNYSAGYTLSSEANQKPAYDVMHYLTFKTDEDIEKFKNSQSYKSFIAKHKTEWKTEFVLNAEIKM
jgi:Stress responsive A/B Barrel Domain